MRNIKILDCTLRDGGYLNDWSFGASGISQIVEGLKTSGIDYIEGGFLSDNVIYSPDKSLYSDIDKDFKYKGKNYALMVNFGEFDFTKITTSKDIELRIAFKPFHLDSLFDYLSPLITKNISFSLNPMHICLYSEKELCALCNLANEIHPVCLTAVDTRGVMRKDDVERVFTGINSDLSDSIALGIHSHNNLGLSFENVKHLLSLDIDRKIIIDSSLSGISRGGGMLSTYDIAQFLNDNFNTNYDISAIKALENNIVNSVKNMYSKDVIPYRISAKLGCHPNYAGFLISKNYSFDEIENIMKNIPDDLKPYYNQKAVENIITSKVIQ